MLHEARRTPHGASRLVHSMSSWSVKTRRASPRRFRDARVNGNMTMVMHETSTPPPPPPGRFTLGVRDVRLIGENRTCSVS